MKKTLVAAALGIAAATTVFGQGSILLNNYVSGTYNQVVWGTGTPQMGTAVTSASGIELQLYWGPGVLTDYAQLTAGVITPLSAANYDPGRGFGGGGYFTGPTQQVSPWVAGDTFTFGLRVVAGSGTLPGVMGESALWQESANIHALALPQFGLANFPGLTVIIPEPTTFALAGLGSAALLIFRRRRA